ncbi:hypothetical protein ACQP08_09605 [Micromonospora zamorensis]|uniref:hypothetical protein n=1 Tax=Micromonospora zamorensis TaxID=709883 RepID=UPI003D8BF621
MKRTLAVLMTVVTGTVTFASPAQAADNDSFLLCALGEASGACVRFVDYGEGAPGGGMNDDYAVVHDLLADGKGTRAYAWLNGRYLGSKYNGNGYAGDPVVWDPFGNVPGNSYVGLKVCLSWGPDDPNTYEEWCNERTIYTVDG